MRPIPAATNPGILLASEPLVAAPPATPIRIARIVDIIMEHNSELYKIPENTDKWHSLETEIKKLEQQIDQEIYRLYGLTDKEIKTIKAQ